jgi:hypothetical protein
MNKSIFNSQEGSVSRKEKQTEQGSTYQQNWGLSTVKICGCRLICRWPIQTEVVGKFRVNLLRKQEFIQINLTHQISRVTKEHVRNKKPTTNYQRHERRDDVEAGRHRLEKSETNKRAAAVRADRRERDRLQRRRVSQ